MKSTIFMLNIHCNNYEADSDPRFMQNDDSKKLNLYRIVYRHPAG